MRRVFDFNNVTTPCRDHRTNLARTGQTSVRPLAFLSCVLLAITMFLCVLLILVPVDQLTGLAQTETLIKKNAYVLEDLTAMSHRSELVAKINRYRLDHRDQYWEDMRLLAERGMLSEQMCKGLLYQLEAPIEKQKDFPNYLHHAPSASQLHSNGAPDVRLGTLVESSDVVFGIRFDMPLHIIIAGVTGFGKTTAARSLQKGVHNYNQRNPDKAKSVIVFDRKANDYADLPGRFGWLHYSVPKTMRLSLEAPPGVPPNEWINIVSTIFSARATLKAGWVTVANALRWLLAVLNPDPTDHLIWPDLSLLLDVLNASPDTLWSSKPEYTRAAIQPLEGIKHSSGNAFRAFRAFQVERDVVAAGKSAIISMPNMFPSWTRQFFTDIILAQLLYGRTYRSHRVDSTEVLVIIDEADSDISTEAEEMFSDRMCPVSSCFKTGREFGISVCVIVSSLRSASRFVLSNATNHFIFRLNDSQSIQEASETLMLPPLGELSLNSLGPGECLVKQIGPWPHAMLGKIDYIPPCRTRPDRYDTHPYTPAKSLEELPEVKSALLNTIAESKRTKLKQAKQKSPATGLTKISRAFLNCASLPRYGHAPVHVIFKSLGHVTPGTQQKVIKELENTGRAKFARFRGTRSDIRLVDVIGEHNSQHGKGDTVHTHISHWCRDVGIQRDYERSVLEWLVPGTNHACDVGFKIHDKWHGVEVVVGCFPNIVGHVKACFIESNVVEALTMVTTTKSQWEKIRTLVMSDPEAVFFINRIKFEVAETYMRELWP
jgi:hypothetical protein